MTTANDIVKCAVRRLSKLCGQREKSAGNSVYFFFFLPSDERHSRITYAQTERR